MDWWNTLSTGWCGNVSAGLISGVIVGAIFYWLGGRQLLREATRLRNLANQITRGLEQGGIAKFSRDVAGETQGLVHEVRVGGGLVLGSAATVDHRKGS
ncbi:MAG TPA: hypothetical protein VKU02_23675 [Gemmataceae bacterium]|nr:hypothetical protein [Gemmataceae bacterium]